MLVLSRKIGESIIIGNSVRVTVVDIGQGRVKIGVHAPDTVSVDREEIHDRKQNERDFQQIEMEPAVPVMVHNRLNHIVDVGGTAPSPSSTLGAGTFRRKPR